MGNEAIIKELDGIKQDLLAEVRAQQVHIDKHGQQNETLAENISEINARYDEMVAKLNATTETLAKIDANMGRGRSTERRTTAGQQFTEATKDWDGNHRTAPVVEIERRDLFNAGSLGQTDANLWQPQRLNPVLPQRPNMHIRNLFPVFQAESATIEWIEQIGPFVEAGIQDETISSETGLQGAKKEASIAFRQHVATPYTIAHYQRITKQATKDAGYVTRLIETALSIGLLLKEDIDLLYGTGTGSPEGLMVNSNVQVNNSDPGQSMADTLRHARTKLAVEYYSATGVVMNPFDYEEIEIAKDNNGSYLFFFGPDGIAGNTLWRVPVIETPAMQQGEYLMGDFTLGAMLADWENPTITYGLIDDDFIRNQLVILAEERIIWAVERPRAFVRGEFNSQSS